MGVKKPEQKLEQQPQVQVVAAEETQEPLLSEKPLKNEREASKNFILRFLVLSSVIMVTLFLITYAGYLIAVQYLLTLANKYNAKLLENDTIFLELDAAKFNEYARCPPDYTTLRCLTSHLDYFKGTGTQNLIIHNVLDYEYEISPKFGTKEEFKTLVEEAKSREIGVYVNIDKQDPSLVYFRDLSPTEDSDMVMVSEASNTSCIESYKNELKVVIKRFSLLGVDGFIIADLPCCVVFGNFSHPDECTFESVRELRSIARKNGNPSALIFRSKTLTDKEVYNILSQFNKTYFDGIIRNLKIDQHSQVQFGSLGENHIQSGLKDHFSLDNSSGSLLHEDERVKLFFTILSFLKGSLVYSTPKFKASNGADQFRADIELVTLVNKVKKTMMEVGCDSRLGNSIPEYVREGVFVAVTKGFQDSVPRCVLLVNFGAESHEVNIRAHFENAETQDAKAKIMLIVNPNGVKVTNSSQAQSKITLEPKTALLVQIEKRNYQ